MLQLNVRVIARAFVNQLRHHLLFIVNDRVTRLLILVKIVEDNIVGS